jgi:hypothetical protein
MVSQKDEEKQVIWCDCRFLRLNSVDDGGLINVIM